MIGNEVPFRKDKIERNSLVQSIQPVRKIHPIGKISAGLFNRERRELLYTYVRNRRGKLTKRNNLGYKRIEHLATDDETTETIEQDFKDYKLDLKNRLSFDRAQILYDEPSSD